MFRQGFRLTDCDKEGNYHFPGERDAKNRRTRINGVWVEDKVIRAGPVKANVENKEKNMKIHEFGSGENPKTRQQVVDKIDEIKKQRGEFNIGISLVGSGGGAGALSEASKLVVLKLDLGEYITVPTTFVSGNKESLKSQLHKIVDDLVGAL